MATEIAHPTPVLPASRWPYLVAYLAAVIAAEVLIAIPGAAPFERPFQSIGLGIHILLVFTLMFLSVIIQPKDATLAPLLVAASLASLVRVFSLAVPRYPFFETPATKPLTRFHGSPSSVSRSSFRSRRSPMCNGCGRATWAWPCTAGRRLHSRRQSP